MASAEDAPVSDAEAATLFAPLRDRSRLVLAVSGGPDSTALLLLHARARTLDPTLPGAIVVTVDHGLRPEAAQEARLVAALAARHGLLHRTLRWEGEKPAANLQAEARRARYDLLFDAARDLGCDTVVTAHHADDQAETFLARLARGSGVVGLSAMTPRRKIDGLVLARPFLDLPKSRLLATLAAAGEAWIEDPSNTDRRFDRARRRAAAPLLADLGLTRDRLVATAKAMARAASAIETQVDAALATGVDIHPAGWVALRPEVVATQPEEVRLRLFSRLVRAVGGAPYGPRLDRLEAIAAAVDGGDPAAVVAARTLGGTRIEQRRGRIWIAAEAGRGTPPSLRLEPGECGRWRGRRIELAPGASSAVTIAPLGPDGRRTIAATDGLTPAIVGDPTPPAAMIESALAVFRDGELVACPGLRHVREGDRNRMETLHIAPISP
ncbi:tRNA lysidine(34) synthetase TilS [Pinisolibacter sp.]|uniref:tRNA lysidine(34) synthetase TilS n=1 Tax=Pinisolibacter sp. TaxID=2172024 RepID=UPI002FDCF12F